MLKHVADIGCSGGVTEDRRLEVIDAEIVPNRKSEQIDDFIGMRSNEMRAENAPAILIDKRLVPVDGLGNAAGRIPGGHLRRLDPQFRGLRAGGALGQPDGGDRGQREGNAWHATIVRLMAVAFQDIASGDLGVMA